MSRKINPHNQALFDALFTVGQSIFLVLDDQARIVRFNPFMEQLSGYRLEEVQGKLWCETFLAEEDQPHVRDAIQRIIAEGGSASGNVNPIITRSGQRRQISWRCAAFTDPSGQTLGLVATGQDVTELLESQQRALQAERLAAIGETVAALSHETRNELLGLKMGLEMLADELQGHADAQRMVGKLRDAEKRLRHLFEDVRGYAAPLQLERQARALPEIWRRAWTSLEAARQGRDVDLQEDTAGLDLNCFVDAFRVEQVFRNVFENALQACSDPVVISISCKQSVIGVDAAVRITVRDNGPGLTADEQERIFQAFYSTKSKGTGLGMALAKRFVEAHGGTMAADGEAGQGARFLITLPVSAPTPSDAGLKPVGTADKSATAPAR